MNQDHYDRLRQGISAWNQWRRKTSTVIDLQEANLQGVDLRGAHLQEADLRGAHLGRTCLDPIFLEFLQEVTHHAPHLPDGRRVVYRTKVSQYIDGTVYEVGQTYTAPLWSVSVETACHPGIYAGTLAWIEGMFFFHQSVIVRCAVWDHHWILCVKGCIRCKEITVLEDVDVVDMDRERAFVAALIAQDPTIPKEEPTHEKSE